MAANKKPDSQNGGSDTPEDLPAGQEGGLNRSDPIPQLGGATQDELNLQRKKAVDLQSVDGGLYTAMMAGDEEYVRTRLGGNSDKKLSEAEILVLIKTRQEAEEKAYGRQLAQDAELKTVGHAGNDELLKWYSAFANEQRELNDNGHSGQENRRAGYLDAEGRDPDGYKYYSDFGYDAKGNYKDSYGGVLDKDDVYKDPEGGEGDLRRGIYKKDKDVYNDETKEVIVHDKDGYFHMRRGQDGKMECVDLDSEGRPKGMTEEDANRLVARWHETNKRLSDEEMSVLRQNIEKLDKERKAEVETQHTPKPPNARVNDDPHLPPGPTADSAATSPPPPPPPPPTGIGANAGIKLGAAASDAFSDARQRLAEMHKQQQQSLTVRDSEWSHQFERTQSLHAAAKDGIGRERFQAVDDTTKTKLLAQSIFRAAGPNYAPGEASREKPLELGWVKDKDGGVWDDKGGYFDPKGNYWDKQGGCYDRDGNYTDPYGGFRSTDGSYMDAKGNYVDKAGNLWLADDKSGKPSMMKREGVDYVDILAKAAEKRYGEMTGANPGLTQDDAKTLESRLKKIDGGFTAAANRSGATPPAEAPPKIQSAFFDPQKKIETVSTDAAKTPDDAATASEPASLRRNAPKAQKSPSP